MAYSTPEKQKAHDREAHNRYMKKWRALKGQGYKTRWRIGQLWRKYRLTEWDYDLMILRQEGLCASCRGPLEAAPRVDHCHSTGRVRGLLCCACNRTLGHAKESVHRLECCAQYLNERK